MVDILSAETYFCITCQKITKVMQLGNDFPGLAMDPEIYPYTEESQNMSDRGEEGWLKH